MKTKIIIALVILVLAGLFYTGVLDWRRWSGTARQEYYSGRNALTSKQVTPAQVMENAKICRQNLRSIESAKRAIAQKLGKPAGDVSWSAVLQEMQLREPPKCPDGGEYTLGRIEELPRCTIGAQGNVDPADDHILKQF